MKVLGNIVSSISSWFGSGKTQEAKSGDGSVHQGATATSLSSQTFKTTADYNKAAQQGTLSLTSSVAVLDTMGKSTKPFSFFSNEEHEAALQKGDITLSDAYIITPSEETANEATIVEINGRPVETSAKKVEKFDRKTAETLKNSFEKAFNENSSRNEGILTLYGKARVSTEKAKAMVAKVLNLYQSDELSLDKGNEIHKRLNDSIAMLEKGAAFPRREDKEKALQSFVNSWQEYFDESIA